MSDGMKGTMPKIAAIALALCLACSASASAEDARPLVIRPTTFVCDVPGPPSVKAQEKRQPIPPGTQSKELCPAGTNVLFFYDSVPGVGNIPPPLGLDSAALQPDTSTRSP